MAEAQPQPARAHLAWWARVIVALAFMSLLGVDVLKVGSASSQRSEDGVLRIASPSYVASREVTVVLIDDAYLGKVGAGWPLSYREQGLLLRRLLSYEPAAVFVDLLYRHRHAREGDGDEPADLLSPLPEVDEGARPPALLFAALSADPARTASPPADGGARSFCYHAVPEGGLTNDRLIDEASIEKSLRMPFGVSRPGAKASDEPVAAPRPASAPQLGVGLIGWSGCGGDYPLLLGGSSEAATPAFAMFRAYCARRDSPRCADLAADGGNGPAAASSAIAARFIDPMIVRWGAFPSSLQSPFYAAGVCQRATDDDGRVAAWRRWWRSLRQLALGAIFDMRLASEPELSLPCPAVPVIRADALLDGDPAALRSLLAGKAVFLGANVSGIPDWVTSPVHGRIPGVVLHAMALDNLLVDGRSYLRRLPDVVDKLIKATIVVAIALGAPALLTRKRLLLPDGFKAALGFALWGVYALFLISESLVASGRTYWYEALAVIGVAIAFDLIKPTETFRYALLLTVMAAMALVGLRFGWSPWNWIGLLLVMAATLETLKSFLKPTTPKPFPHPASLLAPVAARLFRSLPLLRRSAP